MLPRSRYRTFPAHSLPLIIYFTSDVCVCVRADMCVLITGRPEKVLNVLLLSTPYSLEAGLFLLTEPGVRLVISKPWCSSCVCLFTMLQLQPHDYIYPGFLPEFWLFELGSLLVQQELLLAESSSSALLRQCLVMQNTMTLNSE